MSSQGTMDHKCPSCSATLKFNPHGQNWKCEYCKGEFNKEQIDEYEAKRGNVVDETTPEVKVEKDFHGIDVYSCPNCGAQIIADENTTATFCVYCKNTAILKNKLVGEFNPAQVIPFYKTKEDAINAFKGVLKGKPLAPSEFNDPKNINEMTGVYIPFWIYDIHAQGMVQADAKKIRSWVAGDYQYTQTDTFMALREGNMVFNKIPVDGSTRFDDSLMNSIEPFDYKGLVDFSHSYLSGFLAEKYDVAKEAASEAAENRAKNTTTDILKGNIGGYTSVTVTNSSHNLNMLKTEYVLLPVWMLNIKYEDKIYPFAMNGQTGKLIGNIPIDKKKALIWWLGIFAVTFAICAIVWLLGGA